MTPRFYECACCGEFHKPLKPSAYLANNLYAGDCRNDANRFSGDHPEVQEAERLGLIAWEDLDGEFMANFEECRPMTPARAYAITQTSTN